MESCLFCKIVARDIPATIVYSDDEMVAIEDIQPVAPHHLLLIPRKHVVNILDLAQEDDGLVGRMMRVAARIAQERGIADDGFRVVTNINQAGGQSVFHLHFHLVGGRLLHWPPG